MAHVSTTGSGTSSHSTIVVHNVKVILQSYPGTAGADRVISGINYTATIGTSAPVDGTTGADGAIELHIPAGSKAVVKALGSTYQIFPVARLEAHTTLHGQQRRLQHLGYELGGVDGVVGKKTGTATLQFQADNNLDTSGSLTAATVNQIKSAMGE